MISLLLTVMPVPCTSTSQVCPFNVISTFSFAVPLSSNGRRKTEYLSSAATGIVSR